jgi:DNA-binding MarR family transcriptional regulator
MIALLEAIQPDEFLVLRYMDCSGNQAAEHLSVALGLDFERVWRALDRLAQRGLVFRSEEWVDAGNGEGRFELAGWRVKRDTEPLFQWGGSLELLEAIHSDEFAVFLYLEDHGFRPPHILADILGLDLESVEAMLGRLVDRGLIFRINSCVLSEDGERKYEPASWWVKRDLVPPFQWNSGPGHLVVIDGIEFDDGDEEREEDE